MSDQADISFITAVVCDDIRREDNGKEIIIGVYSAGIGLQGLPTDLVLALWISYTATSMGNSKSKVRVVGPNDAKLVEANVDLQVQKLGAGSIAMRGLPVQIQNEGRLRVEVQQNANDWQRLTELLVTTSNDPAVVMPFGRFQKPQKGG